MKKPLTDAAVIALYKRKIDRGYSESEDRLAQTVREVRACLRQPTLAKAAKYLARRDWGEAYECAMLLRGPERRQMRCPKCGHRWMTKQEETGDG